MQLRMVLLARGAFNLLFGISLLAWIQGHELHGLSRGGLYALMDGILGLVMAWAILPHGRDWAFALTLADALVRVVIGALILGNPGMQSMPLGSPLFFTGVIFVCLALGIAGLIATFLQARSNRQAHRPHLMTGPMLAMSLSTLLLGVCLGMRFLEDQERVTLALYAVVVGCAFAWSGYRMRPAALVASDSLNPSSREPGRG